MALAAVPTQPTQAATINGGIPTNDPWVLVPITGHLNTSQVDYAGKAIRPDLLGLFDPTKDAGIGALCTSAAKASLPCSWKVTMLAGNPVINMRLLSGEKYVIADITATKVAFKDIVAYPDSYNNQTKGWYIEIQMATWLLERYGLEKVFFDIAGQSIKTYDMVNKQAGEPTIGILEDIHGLKPRLIGDTQFTPVVSNLWFYQIP